MENEELMHLYTTMDTTEADMIRAQLESEGIECFFKSDNAGGVLPYLTMQSGIEIFVRESEIDRACDVMEERRIHDE